MANAIVAAKRALRQQAKAIRAAIPAREREAAAAALATSAGALLKMRPAASVAGYMPLGTEIDPRPLMQALASFGAALALPRVEGAEISFRAMPQFDGLSPGAFGIAEPPAHAPEMTPGIILVPLLAFDRYGHRLGYGKGFYDRALARLPEAVAVGIAFAAQEVALVPCEPHDRRLNFLLIEAGLIDCVAGSGD